MCRLIAHAAALHRREVQGIEADDIARHLAGIHHFQYAHDAADAGAAPLRARGSREAALDAVAGYLVVVVTAGDAADGVFRRQRSDYVAIRDATQSAVFIHLSDDTSQRGLR